MKIKKRILAGAIAAGLAVGTLAGGSPAVAAGTYTYTASGFTSLASCKYSEKVYAAHFGRKGYRLFAGDACGWWGARKYGFSLTFYV